MHCSDVCASFDTDTCGKRTLAFEAIADLHKQLDDDQNGGVDPVEAALFLKDKLSSAVDDRRQKDLSRDDDIISLLDLWVAWQINPAHNWTVKDTLRWLHESVELPEYDQTFLTHGVDGESLPRLVTRDISYLQDTLLIKNPFHRRKLTLKTMDLILFGPPKKPVVAFYKELSILIALVTGVFGVSIFFLSYYYSQKLLGGQKKISSGTNQDGLYRAEQTLHELQQELLRLKDSEPNFNHGGVVSGAGRMTFDAYEDGCVQSDSGRSSEKSVGSMKPGTSSPQARQSIRRPNSFIPSPSWHQPMFNLGSNWEEEDSGRTLLPSISSSKTSVLVADSMMVRSRGGQQTKRSQQQTTDIVLRSTELALWLQLTHELELRHYAEKRLAASKQLMAARDACDRVRRKRNTLMGSVRLIHSDNLDDVDSKLNAARRVLENVTADLHERRNRWSRIEELTGTCLQDPVDMSTLLNQLGLHSSSLETKRSTGQQDGGNGGAGSSSTRTPVDFSGFDGNHQGGLVDQEGWPRTPSDMAGGRRSSPPHKNASRIGLYGPEESGMSTPDSVELSFQSKASSVGPHAVVRQMSRLPRNYSFVRPFATFWRRKAKSQFAPSTSGLHYQTSTANNTVNSYDYIS